jgi:hypothetical protein
MDRKSGPEPGDHQPPGPEADRAPTHSLTLPGLAADPRMPMWITRALLATAVGAAVLVWQDWRLGLTAAALVVIADIVVRSRTTPAVPAAVMVSSAQRRTRRRLAGLRKAGYVALNRRAIPGSQEVIDHLVIGPPGVFALDSERWDKRLPVRTVSGTRLFHGPFSQHERLDHATWEAAQASALISASLGHPVTVRPAMAIYGPTIPWSVAHIRGVDVLSGQRLPKYFRRLAGRRKQQQRLSPHEVALIHDAAEKSLPAIQ